MKLKGKLKKLWRDRKKLWREYQFAVWLEIIVCGIVLCCSGYLYSMEKETQTEEVQTFMAEMQATVAEAIEDGDEEEALYKALEALPHTGDDKKDGCYGLGIMVYSDYVGQAIADLTGDSVVCRWQTASDGEVETEYFALNNYFSEEAMADFFSWYSEYQKSGGGFVITEMDGYYKYGSKNSLTLLRVVFTDSRTQEVVYELESNSYLEGEFEDKMVCRLTELPQDEGEISEDTEFGNVSYYIYTIPAHAAQPVIGEDECEWILEEGITASEITSSYSDYEAAVSVPSSSIGAYICRIEVNVRYLAWHSGLIRQSILPLFLISECAAVFLIGVWLYIKKKQKMVQEMRDTFLSAITHEMKTPTAVIKNSVECLEAGLQPEKQAHYLEMIGQESEHMNELLNSMLVYTRMTDASRDLQKEDCSLDEMAHRVCGRYEDLIKKKEISLIWEGEAQNTVRCDIALMEMVVDNFVSNAVKFCRENGEVRITLSDNGITVFNEGEEIPEEEIAHLWEPLYKSDKSRTVQDGSSGMGLAISDAILKMHRADYGVRNTERGPEFYFRL